MVKALVSALLVATALGWSQVAAAQDVGRVISMRGEATVTRAQDSGRYERTELARGMRVREGDQIRTRRDGSL
ncbi:MAG: hypothetical protein AAFQ82_26240, partial [Myxococcota bacterium]